MKQENILEVQALKKWFSSGKSSIKAVDGISFQLKRGETLGIVGESGCGKSTLGRTINRLYEPTEGSILFDGQDITRLTRTKLLNSLDKMKMIFQDPYESLDPRMTVRDIIAEPLLIRSRKSKTEIYEQVEKTMLLTGLNLDYMYRYPHNFSGGQRQRIGIARAIVQEPELIICDEPVSALDVSIQAKIVNLLMDLQQQMGMSYLFISHDLSVVKHISDRIAVLYLGKMMELCSKQTLYRNAYHPYTRALLSAIPQIEEGGTQRQLLAGEIPSPANPPQGCRFHTRCPYAQEQCRQAEPAMQEIEPEHFVACHFAGKIS